MEQLFLQNASGMLGWKVVSHNDLPIQKGIWDVDKVDVTETLDHVRLIFFVCVKFRIVVKFLKSFVTDSMIFLKKLSKSKKKIQNHVYGSNR
jgi:hypothetical protein